ncbi:MAG TPA: hypothetical protein VMJ10_18810, partial [Kofleriaceae bacterium]|nr:hypothetical protein [Kofleriaceae bacterium]
MGACAAAAVTFATWLAASGCGRLHFQSLGDAAADRDGAAGGFAMDPAFGSNGVVVIDNGGIANLAYSIQGIAVQPDGRIVVVGLGGTAANTDTLVVRLLDDGSLDPSFGSGGVVLIDVFAQEEGRSVAIQPDGKLVIGSGGGDVSGPPDSDVIRLAPDGSLDPTFGTTSAGVSIVDFPGSIDSPNGAYLGADGKIAFGGQSYSATTSWDFATSLLDSDGSLDPSFGTGGVVATDLFGSDEFGSPVAMLADGRIYNAGSTYHGANNFDAVLLRLATDGTLDASFASVGYVTVDFEDQVDRATMAALDSSQRIDLVGHTNEGPSQDGFAMRFLDDGSRDAAFAAGDG